MPRALGGAPTLSVQWRSLGRSLLAFVYACAVQLWLAPGGGGASHSVLTGTLLQTKEQNFLEVRPHPALNHLRSPYGAGCCASPGQHFKTKTLGRAWCGHARPTATPVAGKIWCGKLCRLIQRKNKKYYPSFEKAVSTYLS